MKVGIYSHCTIDTIMFGDTKYEASGGPACYCSLTARNQKFDVNLCTKYGQDFPLIDFLQNNKIEMENQLSDKDTTRFKIIINDSDRELFIQKRCEPLEFIDENNDGVIVSPVYNEIDNELFKKIRQSSGFTILDPQGFLRRKNSENKIYLENTQLDFSHVSAIKTNREELKCITGGYEADSMKILQKNGIDSVILTDKQNISVLSKDKIFSIKLPNLNLYDTTGVGDIFSATFCCTMLKEKDILWALSFAGGAAQAALESGQIGLEKIPSKGAIESNAYYFYNTIKFKEI